MLPEIKELKGLIKEAFHEEVEAATAAADKKNEDWQKSFEEKTKSQQKELMDKVDSIAKLPFQKTTVDLGDKKKEVAYGFRVDKQLVKIGQGRYKDAVVNPKLFPILSSEKKDEFAKHMLMCLKAAMGVPKARQDYEDWFTKYKIEAKSELAEGSGATGGYLLKDEFADEMIGLSYLNSVVLPKVTMYPMRGDKLKAPTRGNGVVVDDKSEGADLDETEPSFGLVTLDTIRIGAYGITTNELMEDEQYDLISHLAAEFGEAMGQYHDDKVFNDATVGILANAGNIITLDDTLTSFEDVEFDDLSKMIDAIDQQAEEGAEFFFHKQIKGILQRKKDSTGAYLLNPAGGVIPKEIFEYPYTRVPKMPKLSADAAATPFIAFGNLKHYAMGRRRDTAVLSFDPYGLFIKSKTRFKFEQRWAYALAIAAAFAACKTATA